MCKIMEKDELTMFFFDKRILYIILGIYAATTLIGYTSSTEALISFITTIPGVLIAITFHEYAHAFAAYKLGDYTSKEQGRMSLNPLKHTDPIGLVMLLFVGIGWGKPVQVDSRNFNRNISVKKAEAIISVAGPVANFIMAIIFTIIYAILVKFNVFANMSFRAAEALLMVIIYTIIINIGLGVFNLIPLPPLDGSKVLRAFLSPKADMWFRNKEMIFYIVFLFLWITGIAGIIIAPIRSALYIGIMNLVSSIFGI